MHPARAGGPRFSTHRFPRFLPGIGPRVLVGLVGSDVQLVVRVAVAQADPPELDVSAARRQRRRARRVGQLGLAVEDLEDARARSRGALGQVQGHAERAQRADEHVQQQVEGRELAERQVGVDDGVAAEQQDGGDAELWQEADRRVVGGFKARRHHRLLERTPDAAAEALQLARLAREGLDDAHAGDVLLGVGGQFGDALLGLLDRRARAAAVAVGDHHHERRRGERDQAQPRVDHDHHDAREHDREHELQDEHEAVAEEEAHGRQVDGGPAHQLAGLLVVEEAELQALQLAVEALAQVVLDAKRDAPGDHPPPVGETPAREHDADDRQRVHQQRVTVVRDRFVPVRTPGAGVDRFHRMACEDRQQHAHRHREAGENPGDDYAALVRTQKAE